MKTANNNGPKDPRETVAKITMVAGTAIWFLTFLLRQTPIIQYGTIRAVLGVTPNFGAVWGGFGLSYIFFPIILKRSFNWRYAGPFILVILVLLLASEVIHDLFLNAPFDVWDMVASVVAAVLLWLAFVVTNRAKRKTVASGKSID